MSRLYIWMLGIAAIVIATTSAFFSIVGLAQLFAGAAVAVTVMATALEFAKFVSTGFLYRYWGHLNAPLKAYLTFAVCTLMLITSMGTYGFLTNAYMTASAGWKQQLMGAKTLKAEVARLHGRIKEMNGFVDAIPANRISRKYEFQKIYDPEIRKIHAEINALESQIAKIELGVYTTQTKVGPIVHVAEAFGAEVDTVVKYLTLLFVLVFDPLAVCLIFCWNMTIRLREKYRGDESKIAARTFLSEPVDHRFKIKRRAA